MQTLFLCSYAWSRPGQTLPALVESALAGPGLEGKARLGGHGKWGLPIRDARFKGDWEGIRARLEAGTLEDLRVHAPGSGRNAMAFHLYVQASRGRVTPGHLRFLDPTLPEVAEDPALPKILALSLDGPSLGLKDADSWLSGKLAEWAVATGAEYGFQEETAMPITSSFQLIDPAGRARIRFEDVDYRRRIPGLHAVDFLGASLLAAIAPGDAPPAEKGLQVLRDAGGGTAGVLLDRSAGGAAAARLRSSLEARRPAEPPRETWFFLAGDQVSRAGGASAVERILSPAARIETGGGGLLFKDRPVATAADSAAYTADMQALFETLVPEARSRNLYVTEFLEDAEGWDSPGQVIRRIPQRAGSRVPGRLQVAVDRTRPAGVAVLGEGAEAAEKEIGAALAECLPGWPLLPSRNGRRFEIRAVPAGGSLSGVFPLLARLDAMNAERFAAHYLVVSPADQALPGPSGLQGPAFSARNQQ